MTRRKTNFEKAMTMLEKYNDYIAADIAERVMAKLDPIAAAEAHGWIKHPSAPDHHYKGRAVLPSADLARIYGDRNSFSAGADTSIPSWAQ